jgi:hypothetical protein
MCQQLVHCSKCYILQCIERHKTWTCYIHQARHCGICFYSLRRAAILGTSNIPASEANADCCPCEMKKTLFIQLLTEQLSNVPHSIDIVLGGDFNLGPYDTCISNLCEHLKLKQLVTKPTHYHGNTLDLIFTSSDSAVASDVFPVPYSYHHLTWITLRSIDVGINTHQITNV